MADWDSWGATNTVAAAHLEVSTGWGDDDGTNNNSSTKSGGGGGGGGGSVGTAPAQNVVKDPAGHETNVFTAPPPSSGPTPYTNGSQSHPAPSHGSSAINGGPPSSVHSSQHTSQSSATHPGKQVTPSYPHHQAGDGFSSNPPPHMPGNSNAPPSNISGSNGIQIAGRAAASRAPSVTSQRTATRESSSASAGMASFNGHPPSSSAATSHHSTHPQENNGWTTTGGGPTDAQKEREPVNSGMKPAVVEANGAVGWGDAVEGKAPAPSGWGAAAPSMAPQPPAALPHHNPGPTGPVTNGSAAPSHVPPMNGGQYPPLNGAQEITQKMASMAVSKDPTPPQAASGWETDTPSTAAHSTVQAGSGWGASNIPAQQAPAATNSETAQGSDWGAPAPSSQSVPDASKAGAGWSAPTAPSQPIAATSNTGAGWGAPTPPCQPAAPTGNAGAGWGASAPVSQPVAAEASGWGANIPSSASVHAPPPTTASVSNGWGAAPPAPATAVIPSQPPASNTGTGWGAMPPSNPSGGPPTSTQSGPMMGGGQAGPPVHRTPLPPPNRFNADGPLRSGTGAFGYYNSGSGIATGTNSFALRVNRWGQPPRSDEEIEQVAMKASYLDGLAPPVINFSPYGGPRDDGYGYGGEGAGGAAGEEEALPPQPSFTW